MKHLQRHRREDQFERIWQALSGDHVTEWEREFMFHPERKWRFDFACLAKLVAIEIEGVKFFGGPSRHQTAAGYRGDLEKYNAAVELGWRVLRYTQFEFKEQPLQMVDQIKRVLRGVPSLF